MKTLLITRHAKSDWSNLTLNDFDRKLNDRGLKDAPMMGQRLAQKKITVDLIISSTAARAEKTAILIAKEIGYDAARIQWTDDLYHASAQKIAEHISAIDDKYNNVMIVCHNPGITHFVNMQCAIVTDNVPTCGITSFEVNTDHWKDHEQAQKRLLFFDFPKNY